MLTSLIPNTHACYTSLPVLGGVLEELCTWLENRGYPASAIQRRMKAAPFLDQCLGQRQIQSLSDCTVDQLRACFPRQKGWTQQIAYALGRSLLSYLQDHSRLTVTPPSASERLICTYCGQLARVRGLAPSTIERHAFIARDFLRFLHYDNDVDRLAQVQMADLEAFAAETSRRMEKVTMQSVVARLRSFLGFLVISGSVPSGLGRCFDSPRHYRSEPLVRALAWNDVLKLLNVIDRSTLKGRRDYAMLLLIVTYGLRVSEVASLKIDDIQWREQVICAPRPKVGSPLTLPLTDEVATALVSYLRHRCGGRERRLFLRVRAPRGAIQPSAVHDAFDFWASRANVRVPGRGGPHCLRHGLAMHLLRQGTPVKTISDLLGHRSIESTGIYLRLHVDDLRDVALSLPTPSFCPEVR